MVRFRHYDGFKDLPVPARIEHARQLIDMFTTRLRSGWSPLTDDTTIIYSDQLEYKSVAEIYGSRRSTNRNIRVLVSAYLDEIRPGVRHATWLTYKSKLRIFVLFLENLALGDNDIATFDNQVIVSFFNYLIATRKLSRVSIRKYTELLYGVFESFKKKKYVLYNPVHDLPACNRVNDQAPRPIMRSDIDIFKKEIRKDPELWLAVQLEYYCGMRPGHEIREMKIKNIDFIAGTIHVDRVRAKTVTDRVVTIPSQLLVQLTTFYKLQEYDREYYVFGRGGHPGPIPVGKNKMGYKFRKIRERLHMPIEYKFYSWKHTGAIDADHAGIPFKDISMHLGHTSIKTTDIYFRNKKVAVCDKIRTSFPDL